MTELQLLKKQIADLQRQLKNVTGFRERKPRKSTVEREKEKYFTYMNGLVSRMKNPANVLSPSELVDCICFLQRR